MVRRLLLLVMLVQVLAATGIAWGLARVVPLDVALVAAVGVVLLVRMAITANNFRLSRRPLPQHARLGVLASMQLFFHEFMSTMLASSWTMLRHRPRLHLAAPARALPVLLVHGYGCNGGYWAQLAQLLTRQGVSHASVDLEPVTGSIDDFAQQVEVAVQDLLRASGAARVILVGHSMGGLVARAWLQRQGGGRAARIVTVGTPHHGTDLAVFGPGHNARQMRRGADWLAQLEASDRAQRGLITSIYSHHDNIIAPQDSCHLPGARNIAVSGIGHVALGRHPLILQYVLAEIFSIT